MRICYFIGASAMLFAGAVYAGMEGPQLSPGLWQSTVRISMAPNAKIPPQIAAQMAKPRVFKKCLTPAMAAQASQDHFSADKVLAKRSCARSGFGFVGGRIEQTIICHERDGSTMNIHMTGTYTPTATHMQTETIGTGKQSMMQKMTVDTQRLGECTK